MGRSYSFPALCVKCARGDDLGTRTQAFAWFPQWTYALMLVGLLPAVIVQTILTKRATLHLPLCGSCSQAWKTARLLRTLAFVIPVVGGLGLAIAGFWAKTGFVSVVGFLLFFPGVLSVIPIELIVVRARTLRAVFIDNQVVTLKGVSPHVLEVMRRG